MNNISIVDVTLRDGGCVNDFAFGNETMRRILAALEASGADCIELGYIDTNGDLTGERTKYGDETVIPGTLLTRKKPGVEYVAMIDYGRFDISRLGERRPEGIDGIRMAFHKKDWEKVFPLGRQIMDKGYRFYLQPMIAPRYSDREYLELICAVNQRLPDAAAFYIVDSFGEMREDDVVHMMHLADRNLAPDIPLGFHSHNNLQRSMSNAIAFLDFTTDRDLLLDASVMGMGKGAGNLDTELLMEHLDLHYGKRYDIDPLMDLIDTTLIKLRREHEWGYAPQYYLSAMNRCSPTYAAYYYNKRTLSIEELGELLKSIPDEKKVSFDKALAEALYQEKTEAPR